MKKLLLLFLSLSLLGGHAFGMKRKRQDDDGGWPSKKRKSIYDQYLKEDGKYCCPDCEYVGKTSGAIKKHLFRKTHGHFRDGKRAKRRSFYDRYQREDELYYCPDCDYKGERVKTIGEHMRVKRHGHFKGRRQVKRSSIFDQYWSNNSFYCCPDCDYKEEKQKTFKKHLYNRRHGHLKGVEKKIGKKRKQTSVYDQYLKDGFYYCSDCDYKGNTPKAICNHLSRKRHGHHLGIKKKTMEKKNQTSVYDQYLNKDGLYCCPDCSYENKGVKLLGRHMRYWGHGHHLMATRRAKKKRRASICDQYLNEDGWYHCPNCSYKNKRTLCLRKHLRYKRHGHFKEESIQKIILENIVPQESIVIDIDEDGCDFELTVAPVFSCQDSAINSLFYALFNALCLLTDDIDLMYDREQLNNFVAESQGPADVEKIIKANKLLRPLANNLVVVDDVSMLDFVEIDKNKQKIIILNLGEDHWIAIKVSCQNGENNVEIADALYAGFEDFEELVDIAKRLM